jgi:hypothetical protein
MIQAEIEEYMKRFWAAPTGTGTALRKQLNRIEASVTRAAIAEDTGLDQPLVPDAPPTPDPDQPTPDGDEPADGQLVDGQPADGRPKSGPEPEGARPESGADPEPNPAPQQ